ncbi:hypothetical protein J4233_03820 [Candidatus Pacearchaeota archaeon]|nr:hypothetical protein [Candidatus Pacearchaeota archaeon]
MSSVGTVTGWGYRLKGIKPFLTGVIFIIFAILAWIYVNLSLGFVLLLIGIGGIIVGIVQWKTGSYVMKKF